MIDLLNRTSPRSLALKRIASRLVNGDRDSSAILAGYILGNNFNDDEAIYQDLIKLDEFYIRPGKIIALCVGWPESPELKQLFDRIKDRNYNFDRSAAYHLRFLFRDVENCIAFFYNVIEDYSQARYQHKDFIFPLTRRINNDQTLRKRIKEELLKTTSTSAQVSFFSILNSVNGIDSDILNWKTSKAVETSSDQYGYNILKNELIPLSELLYRVNY